ncbi:MAG: ligase-associated DNA damage response endonuclease PdeM [Candidatus Promineifilaceae bacterium]|nr:ligase-associated DNA damage response endonuclease PdeM [Candidatus Promineifilaceae bacterium]
MSDLGIEIQGERLHLLPERAVHWPRRRTLVAADLHLGKATSFRTAGIPLPGGITAATLARLGRALVRTRAERFICLGDLLHANSSRTQQLLAMVSAWRQEHRQLEMILVRGNHDFRAGDPPPEWVIDCTNEPLLEAPFAWQHYPAAVAGGYGMGGHLHPAVRLRGGAFSERLPCFYFGQSYGMLPAFGAFTGSMTIRPVNGDSVFVVADDAVIDVSPD